MTSVETASNTSSDTPSSTSPLSSLNVGATFENDKENATALAKKISELEKEIHKVIIGQNETIEHLLVTLFSSGHALFVGLPGLGKTLLINTLANALSLKFNRIQFTPDLMPSDITGTEVIDEATDGKRQFRFAQGPVFCNILLADEINRTPPKTQAALLQSMQEGRVTVSGHTHALGRPFHVFATQNPIEQEGTYPLPEAQLDRFMMMLKVDYPNAQEEEQILAMTEGSTQTSITSILSPQELIDFQGLCRRTPVATDVITYATRLIRETRPSENACKEVNEYVSFGVGPRAGQHLLAAAKTRAVMQGRFAVDKSDIRALAFPTLRHRIVLNFQASARKIDADRIINSVLAALD